MERPSATEPSPVHEGDFVAFRDGRVYEVVHVGTYRVLGCSPHLSSPEVRALKWEDIELR